jgi:predicted nucleic acid-binding Zn ribbon protein
MSDAPLTDCPACGKPDLQKLVSAAGFQLKGTGWYVTDFRDKGKKPAAASSTEDTASGTKSNSETTPDGIASKDSKTSTDTKTKDTAAT